MPVIRTQFTLRLALINHAKIKKIADAESRTMTNKLTNLVGRFSAMMK